MTDRNLKVVQDKAVEKPPGLPRAKQFGFIENPATVLLIPGHTGPSTEWWSHDGILLGGIKVNSVDTFADSARARIRYLPTPIPRSWGEKNFGVTVEYEAEDPSTVFAMRLYYGCGDPSELHLGETEAFQGHAGAKHRFTFKLSPAHVFRNELFRATLEVQRATPNEVLIYGAWLEVTVD